MSDSWVLKRKDYDGGELVVAQYRSRTIAQKDAEFFNDMYQSSQYHVEPFDTVERTTAGSC